MKSSGFSSRIRYGLLALPLCGLLGLSGCASGPSGGAAVPNVANRLTATLTLQNTLNQNYYYAVAFDDNPGADAGTAFEGPTAIIGNTPILNGVVGGNWRVAVVWHANQFQVYRRGVPTDPDTESRITNGAIISSRASGTTIEFTLNLDYIVSGTTRLFPLDSSGNPTQVYDVNFVTTNEIIVDPNDSTIKPVDSLGTAATSSPATNIQLSGTTNRPLNDATGDGDVNFGADRPVNFNFGQIDVARLNLAANRTDAP